MAVEEREHIDTSGGFHRARSHVHEEIARRSPGSIRETY
jgi:hypothetical protein